MKLKTIITPAALVLALSIGAAPASAQGRGQRDQNGRTRTQTAGRAVQRQDRSATDARQYRNNGNAQRAQDNQYVAQNRGGQYGARDRGPRYDTRRYEAPRYDTRRYVAPGYGYGDYYPRRGLSGLVGSLGLGFNIGGVRVGLFAGRPFPYRYGYGVPAYRYNNYSIRVAPGVRYGGVSFLITPAEASVYIDGYYAGLASDFYGDRQPLPLTPGVHRVELQAEGYAPMVLDVDVMPGQVIPYEGSLRPLY
jgi:hypothetical protein